MNFFLVCDLLFSRTYFKSFRYPELPKTWRNRLFYAVGVSNTTICPRDVYRHTDADHLPAYSWSLLVPRCGASEHGLELGYTLPVTLGS